MEKEKCAFCGEEKRIDCDWRQGRCPHRSGTESSAVILFILIVIAVIGFTGMVLL
jgi:hypothetical protein